MSSFDERKNRFEAKFAHDQEQTFKAEARRNRLLGIWAAEKMGLSGEAADNYVTEVLRADLEEAGDEDVFRKIRGDFDKNGIQQSDHRIRRTMDEFLAKAQEEIQNKG